MSKLQQFDSKKQYPRHSIAYKEGGIHNSQQKMKVESSVITNYIKQISKKIAKGELSNMNALSKPVKLCTHISLQEVIALDNQQTDFMDMAYQYTVQNDPVKRLSAVVSYIISGIPGVPAQIFMKVPMDPAQLGETVQLEKKSNKNVKFTSECISLAPPVCLVYITGDNKDWTVKQQYSLQGSLDMPKMNSISATTLGEKCFSFREADGSYTDIVAENFMMKFEGILMGERLSRPYGSFKVTDAKNKLQAEIKFNYVKQSTMSKLGSSLGGLFSSKKEEKFDFNAIEGFTVEISKVSNLNAKEGDEDYVKCPLVSGGGNYVEYLQIGEEVYWTADQKFEEWVLPQDGNLLKSDCSFRESKTLLQMEDYSNAEKVKNQEEAIEQNDVQLRQQGRNASKARGCSVLEYVKKK